MEVFIILGIIAVVEVYYWFFWLPRNWRKNKECTAFVRMFNTVYRDGHGVK